MTLRSALLSLLGASALLAAGTPFRLRSASFRDGAWIPVAFICRAMGGENRSPALAWSAPPPGTKSLVLILHDPDAPVAGGWWHWALYNLPPKLRALAPALPPPGRVGIGSSGKARYDGPCPPPGRPHHYRFTLYALNVTRIGGSAPLPAARVARLAAAHVIARARFTGLYGYRPH